MIRYLITGGECLKFETDNIRNDIKALVIQQGWSLTRVVDEINKHHPERKKTTVQNISNKLSRGTIKFSEVLEIADIIGVEIHLKKQ